MIRNKRAMKSLSSIFRRLSSAAALLLVPFVLTATAAARQPNIIFILMDDMGWRDVGFMGNEFVETPNLNRLAKEGLIFSQAYASAPNCAPTRACLMSGQYTPRHGVYTVVDPRQPPGSPWHKLQAADSKSELAPEIVTVAEALQSGGYATAFFGMWNLGRGRAGPVTPGGQGFQHVVFPENLGFGKDEYFDDGGNYLSDRLTDEVLKFVEQNRDRPFFVYYPDHAVHAPFNPKEDLLKKYERKAVSSKDRRDDPAYAATIEAVDPTLFMRRSIRRRTC
jgi:arylsulfatase A-like enzyme